MYKISKNFNLLNSPIPRQWMRKLQTAVLVTLCSSTALMGACGDKTASKNGAKQEVKNSSTQENKASSTKTAKPVLTVNTVLPTSTVLEHALQANGNIAAWQEAVIGAEVNGLRIASVNVNVGDVVKKGQVLATFITDTIQADLLQAQANYELAKADAQRARSIADTGALSQQQLDQTYMQEKVTQAQLQSAQIRNRQTSVRAPDNGIISQRLATVGAVAGAGQELFRLVRQSRLEWRGEVTAQEVGRVHVGQTVQLQIDGADPKANAIVGRIRAIAPNADAQTRNILVYADLPPSNALKAGMYAKGQIVLEKAPALTVPLQSVVIRDGFSYVFVVDAKTSLAQMRKVQTGMRQNTMIEIVQGLNANEQVIATGAGFLNDGDLVKVVQP